MIENWNLEALCQQVSYFLSCWYFFNLKVKRIFLQIYLHNSYDQYKLNISKPPREIFGENNLPSGAQKFILAYQLAPILKS